MPCIEETIQIAGAPSTEELDSHVEDCCDTPYRRER
jgi:hypothetical protein